MSPMGTAMPLTYLDQTTKDTRRLQDATGDPRPHRDDPCLVWAPPRAKPGCPPPPPAPRPQRRPSVRGLCTARRPLLPAPATSRTQPEWNCSWIRGWVFFAIFVLFCFLHPVDQDREVFSFSPAVHCHFEMNKLPAPKEATDPPRYVSPDGTRGR